MPIGKPRWPPWPLISWVIFNFFSGTTVWNSTYRNTKMNVLASDWLKHFQLLWNCWTEFKETWQEARSQRRIPSLCFSCWSVNQDVHPGLWLAVTISTSYLELLIGIYLNLQCNRKQDLNVPSHVCVFQADWKIRMATLASDWLRHFWLLCNSWTEFNDTGQDLNVLYKVYVYPADRKTQMTTLAPLLVETFSTSSLES